MQPRLHDLVPIDGIDVAADAVIEHAVTLRGATRIGAGALIDVGSVLTNVVVASGAIVKPYTPRRTRRSASAPRLAPSPISGPTPDPLVMRATTTPLALGRASQAAAGFFNGILDEMAIYDHALTPERIALHFKTGSEVPQP